VQEISGRFGETFSSLVEPEKEVASSLVKLFFKEGMEYDGGGAGVLQTFHVVEVFG
jgi:hypothetical protein